MKTAQEENSVVPTFKRKSIGGGVYLASDGGFWARPWVNHRRTWRKLKAVKRAAAYRECATTPWAAPAGNFTDLAQLYIDAGCPNRRLETRGKSFCGPEEKRVGWLVKFFGPVAASQIRLANLPAYAKWRKTKLTKTATGERTIDLDLTTLSNVLGYGVSAGQLEINFVRSGRPRYRKDADVRRSRQVAPPSADAIHALAERFFDNVKSEVLGWQLLFAMKSGCRTNELLRMRLDAKTGQPGHVNNGLLSVHRSKRGVNPFVSVDREFSEMLECFQFWHDERHPKSDWFFPGRDGNSALSAGALAHALRRECPSLSFGKITPHGLRSFYVTKRRSDGVSDTQIAGEIGDKTSALMETTYGARPANWNGGTALTWVPKEGLPAWLRWRSVSSKVVKLA